MNIKWGIDKVCIDVCWRCPCSRYYVIGSRAWSLLLRSRHDFLTLVSKSCIDVAGRRYQAYVRCWFCTIVSNDYAGDHQLRTLTRVYDQDVGWLAISVFALSALSDSCGANLQDNLIAHPPSCLLLEGRR